ncbi:unnamed protein product [Vicia faba]|uniref:ABC transporter domain-containing protein n=1 Tax=Vicia faba TaxID=3906 RepID=A0AAV0Z2P6_VICFA|nr:unnamed protein product [Vicia faba]
MGKKKTDDAGPPTKAKASGKDVSKKEKLSVSALLASMKEKADNPIKASSSSKPKPKLAPKASTYTDGIDLPPSSDDESEEELEQKHRPDVKPLEVSIAEKELKKREKKDILAAHQAEQARKEALRDDHDAFTVVIGSRASVLDGDDGADANVKDITIENFSVSARGKELLKNASVKISHGKRYGLVGPNGMGKSTLLKLLAWRKIPVPKNIDVLLVEQEVVGDDKTALEAVVSANAELVKVRQEVADLQNAAAGEEGVDNDDTNEDGDAADKLAELYDQLQLMGSDAAESQASKILAGLGFTKDMQGRPTKSFSGGWRMRISLARALFVQPTLLLLDEPTNHLDLRAVLWLEEYLCRWKKTLVVVSHDRDFLNTRRREVNKKFEIYDKQLKAARRTGNKAQQDKVKDRAKFAAAKQASKSKSKGKVDDEDEAQVEAPHKWRDYSVEFHFPEPTELTPPLLQLIEVSFSYPNRKDFRLSNVDVGIDMGTRVAIVGPNGAGKSTLLNLLAGDLDPSEGEGEVRRSQKLRIGRYSQHFVDLLTMDETPVQYLLRLHPDQEGLSKQEAVRAKLGGVVLVSHDSRLISRVCDDEEKSQIWVVEDGTVRKFPGTFDEYKEDLLKEIKAEVDD